MTERTYEITLNDGTIVNMTWADLATCYNKFRHINLVDYILCRSDENIPDEAIDNIAWRALDIKDNYCDCEDENEALKIAITEWKEENI